jgi:catechol 2,3-dioxygenase-like lactoylglutathione lyase family enzyme
MRTTDATRPLTYQIPTTTNAGRFEIIGVGAAPRDARVIATDVRFDGVSVRFHTASSSIADCALAAIPALGYKGNCTRASGDSIELTLVPPVPGMLLPDHEVLLARDAALPSLAAEASVYVLGPSGYREAEHGANGYTCFVKRPRRQDFWPICHSSASAEALLKVEQLRAALRTAGITDTAISDSVQTAYRTGRLQTPPAGSMAYMLSRYAWTADAKTGKPEFIGPHLHFYTPGLTNEGIGVDFAKGLPVIGIRVENEGSPDASTIVAVRVRTPASSPPTDHPEPPALTSAKGAFFAVVVPDLAASEKWYTEKLGLHVATQPSRFGKTSAVLLEGGGLVVELLHDADATASSNPRLGISKAGVVVDDFDKVLATVRARGIPIAIGPFPPRATQRANFLIRDDAGNLIQILGDYAR